MKKIIVLLLVCFLTLTFAGCKKDKNASITLSDENVELEVGEKYAVNPTIKDAKTSEIILSVDESSPKDVLKIDGRVVEALKEGTVKVNVTLSSNADIKASLTVTVKKASGDEPGSPEMVIGGKTKMQVGDEQQLNVIVKNIDKVTYTSSDPSVATVENGKVTALKEGNVTITIAGGGLEKTIDIVVSKKEAPVEVTLSVELPTTMNEGTDLVLDIETNSNQAPVVTSTNNEIIKVENNKLTALKAGKATIKVSVEDKSVEKEIEVLPAAKFELDGADYVFVGSTITLKVDATGIAGVKSYTSSDPAVATVTSAGVVKGKNPGKTTITLVINGFIIATKEISVYEKPTIKIGETPEWIGIGKTFMIPAEFTNVGDFEVKYKSKDESVASVTNEGLVTALKEGSVKITVSIGTVSQYFVLDVFDTKLTVENSVSEMILDNELQLNTTVEHNYGTVTYTSSNPTVASISSTGLIKALAVGTTHITVAVDEKKVEFDLEVKEVGKIVYNFNGGYSNDYLVAMATSDTPKLSTNNYNNVNGGFWTNYQTDIFFCERSQYTNATFSDRIYVGPNENTGVWEVYNFVGSNAGTWPDGATHCLVISNSYSPGGGLSYNFGIKQITSRIHIGDYVVFGGDYTTAKTGVEVPIYFFDRDNLPVDKPLTVLVADAEELITPSRLGFKFKGWFDDNDVEVTEIDKTAMGRINLTAKWEALNPVTGIDITSFKEELADQEVFQVVASVVPSDAYFTSISYSSSNTTIFEVDETGKITAKNAGTATLTIQDYLKNVVIKKEITVVPNDTIVLDFDKVYGGYLTVGESLTVQPKAIGKSLPNTFTYTSSKADVASIDNDGKITALANGETTITVSIPDTSVNITFVISVKQYDDSTEIGKLLKLLVDNHNGVVDYGNVSLYDDGQTRYYDSIYGSVNNYLFDEFKIDTTYNETAENVGECHTVRRSTDQIEFVCVHDTATLTGTVESIASGMASAKGNGASIHYTVGNDAIYGVVPEKLIAWHAGDGTGVVFKWYDSGVKAPASGDVHPLYDMVKDNDKWYLSINGTKSNIELPTSSIKGTPSKKYLTHLGPTFKVGDNGNYYIGTTWWSGDYGFISSHGGNNNSIGIEMNVNTSSDIMDTWQRTGQLVADILLRYDLDTTRVKMHNTFSGKNCPQCLIAGRYWDTFMKFVEVNYEVMSKYKDAKISIKSNNPDILDDTGRIYNPPLETTTVSYDLTVELGGETKTVTLYSIVNGSTTWEQWDGRYPAKQIWNDGYYSLRNDARNISKWYNI